MEKEKRIEGLEENVMLLPLIITLVLTLLGFLIRLFGNADAASAVLLVSRYLYAWICCLSLGICARDNRYLRMALMQGKYPAPVGKVMNIFNDFLGLVLMSVLTIGSVIVVKNYISGGEINGWILFAYLAPLAGFLLGSVRLIQKKVKGDNK